MLDNLLHIAEHCVLFDCCFNLFTLSGASKFALCVHCVASIFKPKPEPKPEPKPTLESCLFELPFLIALSHHIFDCASHCTNPLDLQGSASPI